MLGFDWRRFEHEIIKDMPVPRNRQKKDGRSSAVANTPVPGYNVSPAPELSPRPVHARESPLTSDCIQLVGRTAAALTRKHRAAANTAPNEEDGGGR